MQFFMIGVASFVIWKIRLLDKMRFRAKLLDISCITHLSGKRDETVRELLLGAPMSLHVAVLAGKTWCALFRH